MGCDAISREIESELTLIVGHSTCVAQLFGVSQNLLGVGKVPTHWVLQAL